MDTNIATTFSLWSGRKKNKNLQLYCLCSVTEDAGLPKINKGPRKSSSHLLGSRNMFLLLQCVLLIQDPTGVYQEKFTDNKGNRHPGG